MKHTPGPWEKTSDGVKAGNRLIALVYSEDSEKYRWWWQCGDANARLIAAAPDMLDALIKCYNHIKNDMCICGIVVEAKEAIERATGSTINQEDKTDDVD